MIDVVWETVIDGPGLCVPWQQCFSSATLLLVPVSDIQGHNLSSYQVSFPFANSCLDQNFSGNLQNKAYTLYLEMGLFQSRVEVKC
jgi:hypothetical protein